MNTCSTVQKCNSFFQQYAMHQCSNTLPPSSSGNPQTIWKYNALYHWISEHSNNGTILEIPGELLVKVFIHKALQWLCLWTREAQCLLIYMICRYTRGCIVVIIYIFSTTIIWQESMNFDTICGFWTSLWNKICVRAQPHFSRGTGRVDFTDLPNTFPLRPPAKYEQKMASWSCHSAWWID